MPVNKLEKKSFGMLINIIFNIFKNIILEAAIREKAATMSTHLDTKISCNPDQMYIVMMLFNGTHSAKKFSKIIYLLSEFMFKFYNGENRRTLLPLLAWFGLTVYCGKFHQLLTLNLAWDKKSHAMINK